MLYVFRAEMNNLKFDIHLMRCIIIFKSKKAALFYLIISALLYVIVLLLSVAIPILNNPYPDVFDRYGFIPISIVNCVIYGIPFIFLFSLFLFAFKYIDNGIKVVIIIFVFAFNIFFTPQVLNSFESDVKSYQLKRVQTIEYQKSYENEQKAEADKNLKMYLTQYPVSNKDNHSENKTFAGIGLKIHVDECPILIEDYNSENITLKIYTNKSLTEVVIYYRDIVQYYNSKIDSYKCYSTNALDLKSCKTDDERNSYIGIEKDISKNGISKIIYMGSNNLPFVSFTFYIVDEKGNEACFNAPSDITEDYFDYLKKTSNIR